MIIVYIYNKDGTTSLSQIFDAYNVSILKKLNDFGEADFSLPANHTANTVEILKEFNEVKIVELLDGVETVHFY